MGTDVKSLHQGRANLKDSKTAKRGSWTENSILSGLALGLLKQNWEGLNNVEIKMAMGNTISETWATEDIDIDYELYQSISAVFMSMMPGYEDIVKEMKAIKGLTIKSIAVANMMGTEVKTTTEITGLKEANAPEGIFELPEGYQKISQ